MTIKEIFDKYIDSSKKVVLFLNKLLIVLCLVVLIKESILHGFHTKYLIIFLPIAGAALSWLLFYFLYPAAFAVFNVYITASISKTAAKIEEKYLMFFFATIFYFFKYFSFIAPDLWNYRRIGIIAI